MRERSGEERIREEGEMAKNIEGGGRNNRNKTGREKNVLNIKEGTGYLNACYYPLRKEC